MTRTIPMRNGIFLAPFHPLDQDPTEALHRDLELIENLDRLGYEEAWIGEHHSAGFEIIASPEVFIAAAAERTKKIRLGTGVVSLPYHNPLMTANRIIQLDHHDPRPRDVRRRPRPASFRRDDAGHRSDDPARSHARRAGGHHAAFRWRGRDRKERLVQPRQRARTSAALHQTPSGDRGRERSQPLGRARRRQIRLRDVMRGGDQCVWLRCARNQLAGRQRNRR